MYFQSCNQTAKLSIDFYIYIQKFVPLLLQKVPSYSEHILEKECGQNAKKLLASMLLRQGILLCNCLPERPVFYLPVFDALRATAQICYNRHQELHRAGSAAHFSPSVAHGTFSLEGDEFGS